MGRALLILPLLAGCDLYIAPASDGGAGDVDARGEAIDGGSANCVRPPCPAPATGSTVCGQIVDLADGSAVTDPTVQIAVRDTTVDELRIGACGYFTARGIHASGSQITFEIGDNSPDYDSVAYLLPFAVGSGSLANNVVLPALRRATDQAWTSAAGEPASFAQEGATLFVFRRFGTPEPGVELDATRYFSFSDTDASHHADITLDPATGADGSLLVPPAASQYTPSEPNVTSCSWPAAIAGTGTGALWVVDVDASCKV